MSIEKIDFELFPSLVSLYKNVLSQEQLNSIYEFLLDEQEKSNMEFGREITLSGKSSFVNRETDILKKISKEIPSCHNLFDIVSHIICDYGKSYGMDYLKIETSWFNIQPVGDILRNILMGSHQYRLHCSYMLMMTVQILYFKIPIL